MFLAPSKGIITVIIISLREIIIIIISQLPFHITATLLETATSKLRNDDLDETEAKFKRTRFISKFCFL